MTELAAPASDVPVGTSEMSAEEARRSHSIMSAVKDGVTIWFALLGGLAAWIIHLLAFVSLADLSTRSSSVRWAMHGITAATLAMTVAALALSVRLARDAGDVDESERNSRGRSRFIGLMGIVIGIINFMLIALEELYLNIIRRSGVA